MAVLTIRHYNDIIDSFVRNVTSTEKSYYLFVGRPYAWDDEDSPPAVTGSIRDYQQSIYGDLVFGKQIQSDDVAYLIRNIPWVTGTVYDCYDQDDASLYDRNFYVITDKDEVYKCIYNNDGGESTVKPDLASTYGTFATADGYIWKYMFTIGATEDTKFTGDDYIPVTANSDVAAHSVNGSVDYVKVDNGGTNYRTYHTGFLNNYVNNYVVQLPNTASPLNDFYTGSSIYLKTGFGAGQVRYIRDYQGITRLAYVSDPFDTYAQMSLKNINNPENIIIGQTVTQRHELIGYVYESDYFNNNDTVVQSDTGAYGTIVTSNSSVIQVDKISSNSFSLNYPIYVTSDGGTLKTGTVSVTAGNNIVTAVSGTDFTNEYSADDYIRVGSNANTNIRRILSVNSTALVCNTAFSATRVANVHYKVATAAQPTSITVVNANGLIVDTNLQGVQLVISNSSISGTTYFTGEAVDLVDSSGVSQLANGTVSYANTSTVVLTNVQGTFAANLYLVGLSSLQNSKVSYVKSDPSITISSPVGEFINGKKIYVRDTTTQSAVANAVLKSVYYSPNELTEYVISPTITIEGDGANAICYAVVNSVANSISKIVMIDNGHDYNSANVYVSSNNLHGSGASLSAVVSPVTGHGSDPVEELGSRHVGIVVELGTPELEQYKYPNGTYRRIGIIEDPLFADVIVDVDSYDRAVLRISNKNGENFANGEIIVQPLTNAAAVVAIYDTANNTYIELSNVRGTFAANNANDAIVGLQSGAAANVDVSTVSMFNLGANVLIVSETLSGAEARITEVISNNQIRLTDVYGQFDANDTIVDSVNRVYANVTAIYTSNGHAESTATFGKRFNQTARITLNSGYGTWEVDEVVTQAVTGASGKLMSANNDVDLVFDSATGSFVLGDTIRNGANTAAGSVLFANATHLKLTNVSGNFSQSDVINNGSVNAAVANVYTVLLLYNVRGDYRFQQEGNYTITGATSEAYGLSQLSNTITYPDLVEESGTVTYLENLVPFNKTNESQEKIRLVVKF